MFSGDFAEILRRFCGDFAGIRMGSCTEPLVTEAEPVAPLIAEFRSSVLQDFVAPLHRAALFYRAP